MEQLGINSGLLLTQVVNMVFLLCLIGLPVLGLIMLFRARPPSDQVLVLWVLVIVAIPMLGPLAYFLSRVVRPTPGSAGIKEARPTGRPGAPRP